MLRSTRGGEVTLSLLTSFWGILLGLSTAGAVGCRRSNLGKALRATAATVAIATPAAIKRPRIGCFGGGIVADRDSAVVTVFGAQIIDSTGNSESH